MKPILIVIVTLFVNTAFARTDIDTTLKRQLDSIMELDQRYRALSNIKDSLQRDSLANALGVPVAQLSAKLWRLQDEVDSANVVFVSHIIDTYGYPGKALVGTPTNEAAWFVIQHSKSIDKYLPVIKKAGKKKELPFTRVAMMEDRYLMYQQKEQIYGTQLTTRRLKNGDMIGFYVWPVLEPEKVNERRKKAGFDMTVEEYAKTFGTTYRVVKLSEVK